VPLLSYHADGKIRLWNVSRANAQVVAEINGRLPVKDLDSKPADITSLCVDPDNHHLFCGDAAGCIAVRDIRKFDATSPSSYRTVVVTRDWAAHGDQVTALDYAANWSALITASADTSLRMWTLEGDLMGTFGSKTWNLRGVEDLLGAEGAHGDGEGSFFITAGDEGKTKKTKGEEEVEEGGAEGTTKLPTIPSAEPRLKPKEATSRVAVADHVVREWLDEKKSYSMKVDPDKRESHRGVQILKDHSFKDIPYLHRHMKVGVAFPEMTRYGKFKQLEEERNAREKEKELAKK